MFRIPSGVLFWVACSLLAATSRASEETAVGSERPEAVLLYPVKEDGVWKFIDTEGLIAVPGPFERAAGFHDGLARVMIGRKWGFIDKTGSLVVKAEYQRAEDFSEGLAAVLVGSKWGCIDREGKMVIEPRFQGFIFPFSQGLAVARVDKDGRKEIFIDKTGKFALKLPPFFEHKFSEGLISVASDSERAWGYMDREGKMVIPPTFTLSAGPFSEGLAGVITGSRENPDAFYIDRSGNRVLTVDGPVCFLGPFSEGLASVTYQENSSEWWENHKTGFIDTRGRVVIEPAFSSVLPFSEGLAAVCLADKTGYISTKGELVIDMRFDVAGSFKNGIAEVWLGGDLGYLEKSGEYLWRPAGAEALLPPDGELGPTDFGTIDVERVNETIKALSKEQPQRRRQQVAQILKSPGKYAPPILYVLSAVLFEEGKKDEAVFWLHAGRLRARFDARRCADETARQAVTVLNDAFGPRIDQYAAQDLKRLENTVARVVDWDRRTPYDYDHRWINLHGMGGVLEALEESKALRGERRSIARSRWAEIAETTRSDYVEMVRSAVRELGRPPADFFHDPDVLALATAAQRGDEKKMTELVSKGVDVNAKGAEGLTPLGWAMRTGDKQAFKRLLQHGANAGFQGEDGRSVVSLAARLAGDSEWLEMALRHGADPNVLNTTPPLPVIDHPDPTFQAVINPTPVFDAILSGSRENLDLLIKAGADLNYRDDTGNTPLICAAVVASFDLVYRLLEAGADFRIKNKQGHDVAYYTVGSPINATHPLWHWRQRVLEYLEQHGLALEPIRKRIAEEQRRESGPKSSPAPSGKHSHGRIGS